MCHILILNINLVRVDFLYVIHFFNGHFLLDVSISGRADLVDDNIKKKDLWNDSLKAW